MFLEINKLIGANFIFDVVNISRIMITYNKYVF